MKILVVGSVAYDAVETPEGKRVSQLGGSASYFSVAASHFTDVGIVGVVGRDFRDEDLRMYEAHGIDISGLEIADGKTFRWAGDYMQDINTAVTHETQLNVFADFTPDLDERHATAPYLFLANINPSIQLSVLNKMSSRPKLVACDTMNLWIDIARPALAELIGKVDALMINEGEARQFTEDDHLPTAARSLLNQGPSTVVIKRGEYGAAMFNHAFNFAAPAYPLATVVDPTGAGDSFAGGFMGYIAATGDTSEEGLRRAAIVGSTMASFAVEAFGLDRTRNLTHEDIAERYQSFVNLTRFLPLSSSSGLPRRPGS
ncbi:MAG: PfkB family carbohydrate kinase [Chloroflexi bacterium]|nr:PfkB family carbohydrate kinase [Chloroflexota bacterium]MDA1297303.1 PfkB family carbohydrate kinase [Chloroflexota bacterium]